MSSLRQRVADMADMILESFILSDEARGFDADMNHVFGHVVDDSLWESDFHLIHELADELDGGGKFYMPHEPDEAPSIWPFDFAEVVVGNADHPSVKKGEFLFHRFVTITPRELRGLTKLVPPRALAHFQGVISEGKRDAWRDLYGQIGGSWVWLKENPGGAISNLRGDTFTMAQFKSREALEIGQNNICVSMGAALTERYEWHVAFGYADHGPRLVVPTNPHGCLALFKDRERDDRRQRRAALRHWVSNHYRQREDDPGAYAYVREHLRGHTRFIWNSLFCEVLVSDYDLEKNEIFRLQAAEWRTNRKHNRVKLRHKGAR